MRLWDYLKMQLKKEIVGYRFIYGNNFKLFICKDCITTEEKAFAKPKNIINKKYEIGKEFLFCDRCGKVI